MARHVLSKRDMKFFEGRMRDYGLWADFMGTSKIEVDEKKDRRSNAYSTDNVSLSLVLMSVMTSFPILMLTADFAAKEDASDHGHI